MGREKEQTTFCKMQVTDSFINEKGKIIFNGKRSGNKVLTELALKS